MLVSGENPGEDRPWRPPEGAAGESLMSGGREKGSLVCLSVPVIGSKWDIIPDHWGEPSRGFDMGRPIE